jgi:hypothetical protein
VQYALQLLNNDRVENGLTPVTLSVINSSQTHANEMLKDNYFSDWDLNGNIWYMRYTIAGGNGSVKAINIAYRELMGQQNFLNEAKNAISDIEHQMMYEYDEELGWGLKENILDQSYNKIGIGVAYDRNKLYLVQEFENDCIIWDTLNTTDLNQINMTGTFSQYELTVFNIQIDYFNPVPLTAHQLENPPYNSSSYNPSTTTNTTDLVSSFYEKNKQRHYNAADKKQPSKQTPDT